MTNLVIWNLSPKGQGVFIWNKLLTEKGIYAMPNYEPNFYNNQTAGMQAKARHTVDKTGGDPSNFVLYKGKRFPVAGADFLVILQGKSYAAIDAPKIPKNGRQVTEVRLLKEGETDYSDASGISGPSLPVYRRFLQYYIADPQDASCMRPICRIKNW